MLNTLPIDLADFILLISFTIIYLVFLFYDLFKRGDKYGSIAYIAALLPSNFLWYAVTKKELYDFGLTGSMMVLAIFWLLAVIRDIFIKDKEKGFKDADDVALMLIIGIVINLRLSAVLPSLQGANNNMKEGADTIWNFFYIPLLDPTATNAPVVGIILTYKILATVLTVAIIIPIVMDLKDAKVTLAALAILTVVFLLPFTYLAFIWSPAPELIWVFLVLFGVIFFTFLLMITRGEKK